ncbi:MAG: phage tail sheath subtilisin-like domain-containing protein [Burkholderiaceae bacterium]|nr:phage tail sheath subtilisin-like domain-containing protein [Burkholderiaceae bacterium]
MATSYLAPGVYVEEVPSGARPIEAVGTSTAAFVGVAPNGAARLNEAVALNNWSEFLRNYASANSTNTPLAQAVYGFFLNGGGRCYVVNVGPGQAIVGDAKGRKGLDVLEAIDEVAIVAAPGYTDAASHDSVLSCCEKLRDRFAILDAPESDRVRSLVQLTQVAQVEKKSKPRGGDGDAGAGASSDASDSAGLRARASDGGYGAFYFPSIRVRDVFNPNEIVDAAPSGYIAGIYARSDSARGVPTAPANEVVRGALGVTYQVTQQEQETLNPNGVNCIRFFLNEGIRVWGARTLAASSSEWRYINVRRLFSMIEESIARATRWVVFEPNDVSLWKRIIRDVRAFLMLLWRQGALMGRTPDQAFFVKCDEETNPQEVIDAGQVVILIGVAPVKPAEFVIFRIGQGAAGTQVETE